MTLRQADATLIPPFWLPKIFMPSSVMFCGVVVIAVTSLLMRMAGSSHSDTDPRIVTCSQPPPPTMPPPPTPVWPATHLTSAISQGPTAHPQTYSTHLPSPTPFPILTPPQPPPPHAGHTLTQPTKNTSS